MSAVRAMRLGRTIAVIGAAALITDQDAIFNGRDLLTLILLGASLTLLAYSKEANNA